MIEMIISNSDMIVATNIPTGTATRLWRVADSDQLSDPTRVLRHFASARRV